MVQKIRYSQKDFKERQRQQMVSLYKKGLLCVKQEETKAKARRDYENRVYGEMSLKHSTDVRSDLDNPLE